MKKTTLIALMTFIPSVFFAQELPKQVKDLINPNSIITSISQDEDYFWIGTDQGFFWVNKQNNKFIHLTSKNSPLPCDYITAVCCRNNGNVWIGTSMGIMRYDNFAFLQINSENSMLPDEFVTSIIEDKNDNLWIGTRFSGLVEVQNNKFHVFNQSNSSLPGNYIFSLSMDQKGNVIVKTNDQIPLFAYNVVTRN
jgi:ligand-binding sensor domain-containing protein